MTGPCLGGDCSAGICMAVDNVAGHWDETSSYAIRLDCANGVEDACGGISMDDDPTNEV